MAPRSERTYQFGPFHLNATERVLLREGERVPLTPKVFETLLILVENAGHIVPKETLIKRVWPDTIVQEDNLTFNVSTLRKALGEHPGEQQFIQTEHKVGYRFVAPVRVLTPTSTEPPSVAPTFRARPEPSEGSARDGSAEEGSPVSPTFRSAGTDSAGAPMSRGATDQTTAVPGSAKLVVAPGVTSNGAVVAQALLPVVMADGSQAPGTGKSACATAAPNGHELVRDERFGMRRRVKWAGLGLALVVLVAAAVWLAAPRPEPRTLKSDQITADGREKGVGLATDGERVYFIEEAPTGWVIAQVSAYGGEPAAIASALADSSITGISPDHKELLVVQGREFGPGTLELVPLFGGEPRRLGNIHAYSASWSPDGSTLAYTAEGGLYLCAPDGSNSRQIVNMSGLLIDLDWSAPGRRLCFTRGEHSQVSLWEVDREGSGLSRLSPGLIGGLTPGHGLWTPNGEYLITDSLCGGHYGPSAVRLPSGPFGRHWGQPACLESGPMEINVSAISPDGARLFGLASTARHPQMEEYDTQSGQFRPFLPGISCDYADFSSDGKRIAYVTGDKEIAGPSSLWVSQIDGSHKVQLTKPPLLTMLPRWSPDGKWIAFMGKDPGQPWRVRVVSPQGGSYAPVTAVNDAEGAPTWSPDSSHIAFGGMTQPPERTRGQLVIHILDLKTGQVSQVRGSEGLWTARWSPDGRYIAAVTQDNHNLVLFDFRTTRWTKLASVANIQDVAWSRHEEALYFNGDVSAGERAIFRLKIPGRRLERLASLAGRTEWDWLGLTPDDAPLIAHQTVTREIYALTVQWP
jgi:Tol biopolymer transport system component/DNA-binding winged helix-turn-helix (wHTH) protein